MMNLKQFVPSEVCLKCDGCCRFKESQSVWRPKVTASESARIIGLFFTKDSKSKNLADVILSPKTFKGRYIQAVTCSGFDGHICSFFNLKENSCRIYADRPFECQLYPFLLAKGNQGAGVYVHLMCPHIQSTRNDPAFVVYVAYLKEFFAQDSIQKFVSQNPSLVGDYSEYADELEFVFELDVD